MSRSLVVATRSDDKLREILQILSPLEGLHIVTLEAAGVQRTDEEEHLETEDTFEGNALAKARYYARRSRLPVLADDSGLCVDALAGGPGVRSKRFSGRDDLTGVELDQANNQRLLADLVGIPEDRRGARYVCVLALVLPSGEELLCTGSVAGRILDSPRGTMGFGYDPLFFHPPLRATFGEIPPDVKNAVSHRANALRMVLPALRNLAAGNEISPSITRSPD